MTFGSRPVPYGRGILSLGTGYGLLAWSPALHS